jgi:hypothetical protein
LHGAATDLSHPSVNFHGERRSKQTHQSTTDPEALLARKGKGKQAKVCYSANAGREQQFPAARLSGRAGRRQAERRAAKAMADERLAGRGRITLAGDKGYDTYGFVASCRALKITPHVAQNHARPGGSALDLRAQPPSGLCGQSMDAQTDRGGLRLDEDLRNTALLNIVW